MTTLFFSYSHKDEDFRDQLETHLAMLKREGTVDVWHDRRIIAGDQIDGKISEHLEVADIVLLLVSPDFLASPYCYDVEVARAMERHKSGAARVIPVILRTCDWKRAPFGKLLATPRDGRPITKWPDRDEAFLDVVDAIRVALPRKETTLAVRSKHPAPKGIDSSAPRSSNLGLRKEFTEADLDKFLEEAFEYMVLFFENSLLELEKRNDGIEGTFKKLDAQQFSAVIYRGGKAEARCRIRLGGRRGFGNGITYSSNDSSADSSFNESLSVEHDAQAMYLRALGMAMHVMEEGHKHLTFEGAAEYYWKIFIEPLQR
jgi:TIR domain-containing protein